MYQQIYKQVENLIAPNIIDYDGQGNIVKVMSKSSKPANSSTITNPSVLSQFILPSQSKSTDMQKDKTNENCKSIPTRSTNSVVNLNSERNSLYISSPASRDTCIYNQTGSSENQNFQPLTTNFGPQDFGGEGVTNRPKTRSHSNKGSVNASQINLASTQDCELLKQVIKTEKNKNMNYRYEIQELKKQLEHLSEKCRVQDETISKIERLRENDKRYVSKMEEMIKKNGEKQSLQPVTYIPEVENPMPEGETNAAIKSRTLSKTQSGNLNSVKINKSYLVDKKEDIFTFGRSEFSININDKLQLKDTLISLSEELEFYKGFADQIFALSNSKEELNESIYALWKRMGNFFSNIEKPNEFELHSLKDVVDDFNLVNRNIQEVMMKKQTEFNFLINARQEQFTFLNDEVKRLRGETSQLKFDRTIDLRAINNLELEKELLTARLNELEQINYEHEKRLTFIDSLGIGGGISKKRGSSQSKFGTSKQANASFSTSKGFSDKVYSKQIDSSHKQAIDKGQEASSKQATFSKQLNNLNSTEQPIKKDSKQVKLEKSIGKIEQCLDMNDQYNFEFYEKLHAEL